MRTSSEFSRFSSSFSCCQKCSCLYVQSMSKLWPLSRMQISFNRIVSSSLDIFTNPPVFRKDLEYQIPSWNWCIKFEVKCVQYLLGVFICTFHAVRVLCFLYLLCCVRQCEHLRGCFGAHKVNSIIYYTTILFYPHLFCWSR